MALQRAIGANPPSLFVRQPPPNTQTNRRRAPLDLALGLGPVGHNRSVLGMCSRLGSEQARRHSLSPTPHG